MALWALVGSSSQNFFLSRLSMKLTAPLAVLREALKNQGHQKTPSCFIDDTEVALKECGVPMEEKIEDQKLGFWDKECDEHPTNSHCKAFDL